jgi:hypothetical protein
MVARTRLAVTFYVHYLFHITLQFAIAVHLIYIMALVTYLA